MSESVKILSIVKSNGVAGQVQFTATTRYPGEDASSVSFVGYPAYGGPVVMITASGAQVFVTDPGRFGEFGKTWVERFFAPRV